MAGGKLLGPLAEQQLGETVRFVRNMRLGQTPDARYVSNGLAIYLAKTTSYVEPRVGTTPGVGTAQLQEIHESGSARTITPHVTDASNNVTKTVYNYCGDGIQADAYVLLTQEQYTGRLLVTGCLDELTDSSSASECEGLTGIIIFGLGDLTRVGDYVLETRNFLTVDNGRLCDISYAGRRAVDVCCDHCCSVSEPSDPSYSYSDAYDCPCTWSISFVDDYGCNNWSYTLEPASDACLNHGATIDYTLPTGQSSISPPTGCGTPNAYPVLFELTEQGSQTVIQTETVLGGGNTSTTYFSGDPPFYLPIVDTFGHTLGRVVIENECVSEPTDDESLPVSQDSDGDGCEDYASITGNADGVGFTLTGGSGSWTGNVTVSVGSESILFNLYLTCTEGDWQLRATCGACCEEYSTIQGNATDITLTFAAVDVTGCLSDPSQAESTTFTITGASF